MFKNFSKLAANVFKTLDKPTTWIKAQEQIIPKTVVFHASNGGFSLHMEEGKDSGTVHHNATGAALSFHRSTKPHWKLSEIQPTIICGIGNC